MTDPNLEKVSKEIAEHFNLSINRTEDLKEIKNSIENVNNQMEEIKESLHFVRQDVDKRSEVASKELSDAADQLENLFAKIDSLEAFVNIVKKSVNDVTDRVDETERLVTNPINRVWDTIKMNTTKSIDTVDLNLPRMKPLKIYNTKDYFPTPSITNIDEVAEREAALQ
ncbi:8871_t:CDS:2 [Ambispora gerdemannii]|uniref:8871_t:CDS:1 n=1 Tax=Ambispora gerdemannii TaxID=144530 RepID=A0A9N8YXM7_9GLOM|nr:8871_t:CDS:2 [Ambispora gerdemannii]